MSRLQPTPAVIKRLFALSGNQCAYPECHEKIVDEMALSLEKFVILKLQKKVEKGIM
jgi:hypothetical protein